ncbi:MAG: hypothetical protein PHT91_00360 [Candidatus Nanoarchaeia archaeon]|nr:hypothetical protein [Candidatus Nanoarchaeia archaeon]MDD5053939.1 hypothetical protein [Candidatus Nanoarchaeia archaeon]MDD5499312.1 hypothetical protein [Candidatus Nanoarchaeia archaeon]
MKHVRVILSKEASQAYEYFNSKAMNSKIEKSIFNSINKKVELIKQNIHYGEPIAKKLIPPEYIKKYGIKNLFRVELPKYWRMLYTLKNGESEIEIISFVLDFLNHKEYNKKFGYK